MHLQMHMFFFCTITAGQPHPHENMFGNHIVRLMRRVCWWGGLQKGGGPSPPFFSYVSQVDGERDESYPTMPFGWHQTEPQIIIHVLVLLSHKWLKYLACGFFSFFKHSKLAFMWFWLSFDLLFQHAGQSTPIVMLCNRSGCFIVGHFETACFEVENMRLCSTLYFLSPAGDLQPRMHN